MDCLSVQRKGEVEVISNGRTIKETDSDWIRATIEQQYFYKRVRGKESWTI